MDSPFRIRYRDIPKIINSYFDANHLHLFFFLSHFAFDRFFFLTSFVVSTRALNIYYISYLSGNISCMKTRHLLRFIVKFVHIVYIIAVRICIKKNRNLFAIILSFCDNFFNYLIFYIFISIWNTNIA